MNVFKVKGDETYYNVENEVFEEVTGNKFPYLRTNREGKETYFALCPVCDNPIELVGLFKKEEYNGNVFGRHCQNSITQLAEYNRKDVLNCPFYQGKKKSGKYKISPSNRTNKLFNFYLEHADAICRIFSLSTGIVLTENTYALLDKAITLWFSNEKWLYYTANKATLPYLTFYGDQATKLYGRIICENSKLYDFLKSVQHKYNIEFVKKYDNGLVQIRVEEGYLPLFFAIQNYKCDSHANQSFCLSIVDGSKKGQSQIIKKIKLKVDNTEIESLILSGYSNPTIIKRVKDRCKN